MPVFSAKKSEEVVEPKKAPAPRRPRKAAVKKADVIQAEVESEMVVTKEVLGEEIVDNFIPDDQALAEMPDDAPDYGDARWDDLELDTEDGRRVYRASLLGSCTSVLVAAAVGVELADLPDNIKLRADEGTRLEPVILAKFHEEFGYRAATYPELAKLKEAGVIAGYNPEMHQVQARLLVGKNAMVRVHPDEIATHTSNPGESFYDVEAKAFGDDFYRKWKKAVSSCPTPQEALKEAFDGYAWQVSSRMACTGLPVIFVVGKKDIREDDEGNKIEDISELNVVVMTEPPYSAGEVKARVMRAEKYARDGVVPDCDTPRWPCPLFKHPAHPEEVKDTVEWEPVFDEEMRDVLKEMDEEKAIAKRSTDRVKDCRKRLDKLMEQHGMDPNVEGHWLVCDEVKLTWRVYDKKGYEVQPTTIRQPVVEVI